MSESNERTALRLAHRAFRACDRRRSTVTALAALAFCVGLGSLEAQADTKLHLREAVLVLHSYSPDFVWTRSQQEGIDAVLGKVDDAYDLRIEYLDAVHHPELLNGPVLSGFIRAKVSDLHPKVVLTSDNAALTFARKHRAELFPDAPIVFMGVNGYEPSMLGNKGDITGVAEDTDLAGTLKLLMQLRPKTRHIVFPGMTDDITYRAIRGTVAQALSTLPPNVATEFREYRDVDEALDDLHELSADAAIVVMTNMRTRDGEGISSQRVVELISAASPAPVFTNWDFVVGRGAVGGSVISGVEQGRLAAQIALRILHGERPDAIPVHREVGKTYLFDYRQLTRFDIATSRLPSEAKVLFAPERIVRIPREAAWTAGISFALLLAITASLVLSIRRRRFAEAKIRALNQELEEHVRERTAQLEAANKAKSIFLANMSHELRTPLNAILGFSSMMRRESSLAGKEAEYLDIINRSGEHLLTLINDVLEITKIEAGRLQLEVAPLDLDAMVQDVTEMIGLRAEERGLYLRVERAPNIPRFIRGDEARLRQILVNLVGNAIKFTKTGGVTVRLGTRENATQHLMIDVEDTGPGLTAEEQAEIFKPFVQLAKGAEQKGTGLGLTITRQFVELMGGLITVESKSGQGARFRVDLPMERCAECEVLASAPPPQSELAELAPGTARYRILIAEDQPENVLLLTRLMEQLGLETRTAENGAECVKLFQEWHPHLIWMDRRMPLMDGIEATRRIRALPGGREVKIVAVTASAFNEQKDEMLESGMDDFIRKPYRFQDIQDCLARLLGLKYNYRDGRTNPSPRPTSITPAALAALPDTWRHDLRDALEKLDMDKIEAAIAQIGTVDTQLAQTLTDTTKGYNYQPLLQALASAEPKAKS